MTKYNFEFKKKVVLEYIYENISIRSLAKKYAIKSHNNIEIWVAKYYDPSELIGKKVAVVANLKPVKLCGELSEGMILSAEKDGILRVVEINAEIPNGAEIR